MEKSWIKTGESKYALTIEGIETGWIDIAVNTGNRQAVAHINNNEIIIRRTGFWKSDFEVVGTGGQQIAKAYAKKWYANSMILEYGGEKYDLVVRNNPLAEWAITLNGVDVLAYGLHPDNGNGKTGIKISSSVHSNDYILDCILWYLFVPVAAENMGDDFTFLMLLTAQ